MPQLIITLVIILFLIFKATSPKNTEPTLMKNLYRMFDSFIGTIRRISRVFMVKKRSRIVWKELVKMHKEANWHFGQFDNEKYIITRFTINDNDNQEQKFRYEVDQNKLEFHTCILNSFNEDKTNDVLVLASHFNGLLNFGKVGVNIKYNYVEFTYSGDLITYMLYPGEIHSDLRTHYNLTKDCLWAFTNLMETDDDPVFVISELLKRKDNEDKTNN